MVLVVLVSLVLVSLTARIVGLEHGASLRFIHRSTLCRMDAISLGSVAAIWLRSSSCTIVRWRRVAAQCVAFGIAGILAARILAGEQSTVISYTFIAISFVGLLGLAIVSDVKRSILGRILNASWIRHTGRISYGLYLLHMPLFLLWSAFMRRHDALADFPILRNTLSASIQFALAFAAATISWIVVESSFLRLKSLFPSGCKSPNQFELA